MQTDVLIIGAGPAGSTTATHLAQRGFRVFLADQKTFPRDKPCGEFLSPQCLPYLQKTGADTLLNSLSPHLVRGMHLHYGDRRALGRLLQIGDKPGWSNTGYGIRRSSFDHALVNGAIAAGVHFLPGHACRGPQRHANGKVTGVDLIAPDGHIVSIQARWVVAADGVRSTLARALALSRPVRWLERLALVGHFTGVACSPYAEAHLVPGGFFAATSVEQGGFSVNLVLDKARWCNRETSDWDTFLGSYADSHAPSFAMRLRGSTRVSPWRGCGPFAHKTRATVVPGMALVGDAAGYVDPLTGEGIYSALCGAYYLSVAIADHLDDPTAAKALLPGYLTARRRELYPRMQASLWLQRLLRFPSITGLFMAAAARWPAIADLVVTLAGDTIHPRDLTKPSFWHAFRASLT